MNQPIRVVLVGLGAVGTEIGRSLALRSDCEVVAAVDSASGKAGVALAELIPAVRGDIVVADSVADLPEADVAVVATTSWLDAIEPTLVELASRHYNVVSICEELSYPLTSHPQIVARLHKVAVDNDVSILGTGCNPGMIMDTLPLALSSLTQQVLAVSISRAADMSRYGAILGKFGLGLTEAEFARQRDAGVVGETVNLRQHGPVLIQAVILQFQKKITLSEHVGIGIGHPARFLVAVRHQGFVDIAAQAGRERDQPLGVLRQQILVDAGLVVEAIQKTGGNQPDQVPVTLLVFAEENQVIVAVRFAADLVALLRNIDFAADHRMHAVLFPGVVKLHRAEQIAMVGHGDGGEILLLGEAHQLGDFAGSVQQRIVRVAMQMYEGLRGCHDSLRGRFETPV